MSVDKEEEKIYKVAPVNCVYFKKSTLNERRKTKKLEKELKKPVVQSKSDNLVLNSDCGKSNSVDVSGGKNIEKVKRCTFFKKSKLDYMERRKNQRLDFFCKHTLRYFPKNKQDDQPKSPAKPNRESVGSNSDRYNPLQRKIYILMPAGEETVNTRAGHVAVSYRQGAIVWSGYEENQDFKDQYHSSSQVWVYSSLTQTWRCQKTTGQIPNKCSGAAATVIGDIMYVVAGFHKVVVSIRALRGVAPDSSDDEDDGAGEHFVDSVEISNSIWCLDLKSWLWTKLQPGGDPPLKCDKTAVWAFRDKVFLFGGFGPPPDSRTIDKAGSMFEFCEDSSTSNSVYTRGWSNQLVCYNTSTNRWEWPLSSGQAPSPRAAHSVAVVNDIAYVFGGRHLDTRINDLYSLDLLTMKWNLIQSDSNADDVPVGRSWQTMTALATGEKEGGLLLYGGFDNNLHALGDCWRMDLSQQPHSWVRCPHLEKGPRLWHAAVDIDPSTIIIIGGLTNNILAPMHVSKHHAEAVLSLGVAPPSLLKLCLEFISSKKEMFSKEVEELPQYLKKIVEIRCSSGA